MYKRGDVVVVEGFGGRRATLIVWKVLPRGVQLCTEERYNAVANGQIPPIVGFPMCDIKGIVEQG